MSKKIGAIVAGVSLFTLVGAFALYCLNRKGEEEEINVKIMTNMGYVVNNNYLSTLKCTDDEIQITSQHQDAVEWPPYKIDKILCFVKSCLDPTRIVIVFDDDSKNELIFDDNDIRDRIYADLQRKYRKKWNSHISDSGENCIFEEKVLGRETRKLRIRDRDLLINNDHKIGFDEIVKFHKYETTILIITFNAVPHKLLFERREIRDNVYKDLTILLSVSRCCQEEKNLINFVNMASLT